MPPVNFSRQYEKATRNMGADLLQAERVTSRHAWHTRAYYDCTRAALATTCHVIIHLAWNERNRIYAYVSYLNNNRLR